MRSVVACGPLGVLGLFNLLSLLACSGTPVAWNEVTYPTHPPSRLSPAVASVPPGGCPASFRASRMVQRRPDGRGGDTLTYGTWWAVRPDSSAVLMAALSRDGGRTWGLMAPAETTDASRRGCARPAPSIYADTNGYVHFAYFLEPRDGGGVFFAHTMNGRHLGVGDGVFHTPVAIVYGERPSHTSVVAAGDTVAVAYEDPNSERPQVALALSRTTGHIFEARVPVSSPDLPAVEPQVFLAGDTVTVVWQERPDSAATGGRTAARMGVWR